MDIDKYIERATAPLHAEIERLRGLSDSWAEIEKENHAEIARLRAIIEICPACRELEKKATLVNEQSTPDVTPSCGCVFCDIKVTLHEDEQGFHHVVKGERVPCGR